MVFKKGKIPWNKNKINIYSQETLKKNSEWHKKSFIERYGEKRAKEIKEKISQSQKGKKFSEEHKRKIGLGNKEKHNKTYEELYGTKKAIIIKNKISNNNWTKKFKGNFPKKTLEKKRQNMLGEKNPMYGIKDSKSPFWKGGNNESSKRSYQNNINFRLKKLIRHRIWEALNRQLKGGKIKKSICYGINVSEIVNHLKKQLPEDFNSGNYDIHHINELINFNLNNPEELKKAFAPENHLIILREKHNNYHHNNGRKNKYKIKQELQT